MGFWCLGGPTIFQSPREVHNVLTTILGILNQHGIFQPRRIIVVVLIYALFTTMMRRL